MQEKMTNYEKAAAFHGLVCLHVLAGITLDCYRALCGRRLNSYRPMGVVKAVNFLSSSDTTML